MAFCKTASSVFSHSLKLRFFSSDCTYSRKSGKKSVPTLNGPFPFFPLCSISMLVQTPPQAFPTPYHNSTESARSYQSASSTYSTANGRKVCSNIHNLYNGYRTCNLRNHGNIIYCRDCVILQHNYKNIYIPNTTTI